MPAVYRGNKELHNIIFERLGWSRCYTLHCNKLSNNFLDCSFLSLTLIVLSFMHHILFAHGAWFMNKYGSLEMWSTQGMEKSHYQARGVFFKHTHHGGGRIRSIYLKEMFNWFYRCTFGRNLSRERAKKSTLEKLLREQKSSTNSSQWRGGTGPLRHMAWRQTRVRVGRQWCPATT